MGNATLTAKELRKKKEQTTKLIVVLSDGEMCDRMDLQEEIISEAKEKNIRIYTVGFGSSTENHDKNLKPLSEKTGGSFYHISDTENITEIYSDAKKNEDIEDNDVSFLYKCMYGESIPVFLFSYQRLCQKLLCQQLFRFRR